MLRFNGYCLIVVGVIGFVYSLAMDISVPSASGGAIINTGLVAQQQALLLMFGILFLAGVIYEAAAHIASAIRRSTRQLGERLAPQPAVPAE